MNEPNCQDCVNSYMGADLVLRCRVHHNGLKCSPEAAKGCKKYLREPGADAEEVMFCQGRGD